MREIAFTLGGTGIVWGIILGSIFLTFNAPRIVFTAAQYALAVFLFGLLAYFLVRKAAVPFSPFMLTAMITGTLLILELFYWLVIYPESAGRYLTVIDWVIPALLAASAVYITALFSKAHR